MAFNSLNVSLIFFTLCFFAQWANGDRTTAYIRMKPCPDEKVSAYKVLGELEEDYNMYSSTSITSPDGAHYMVIQKTDGQVLIQDTESGQENGDFYVKLNAHGQLTKYNKKIKFGTIGGRLPQDDDYVLIVKDNGQAWVQLNGKDMQIISLPW